MNRISTLPAILLAILLQALGLAAPAAAAAAATKGGPLLIEGATGSGEQVIFSTAGRLWRVGLAGGEAKALTDGAVGDDRFPQLSPDGRWLAFSRTDATGSDVWVMPAAGGEARRLTYNPKVDRVRGWTPDSESELFSSSRDGDGVTRLYTIGRAEVFPSPLPLPLGTFGAFSPEGSRLAYAPVDWGTEISEYRYYRGGMTSPLWIADLADSAVTVIADATSNHRYPMWLSDTIYFTGDASGSFNLFAHDLDSGETRQLTDYSTHGIRSASLAAGGERIVFVRDGHLHLYELATGEVRQLQVLVDAPAPERAAKRVKAADWVDRVLPVPGGERLLLAARGDLVLFDPATGAATNLTASSDAAEREPAFSPDGRWLAYFSDCSGEYGLQVRAADGSGAVTTIAVEEHPSFYRQSVFSPDGRWIAFSGQRLGLWLADVDAGSARRIDLSDYLAQELWHPSFSPDGRYLAYAKAFPDHRRAIFVHDTVTGASHRVTPALLNADRPVFDASGRYLHFLTSHNAPAAAGTEIWGQLSAELFAPNVVYRIESAVLRNGDPAPLLPFIAQPHPEAHAGEPLAATEIDFDGIEERIAALPLKPRAYSELAAGPPGVLFIRYRVWPEAPGGSRRSKTPLYRYDLSSHDWSEVTDDVDEFVLTAGAEKVLYSTADGLFLKPTHGEGAEARAIDLSAVEIEVDPAAEWQQIYREAWRLMRDYFYDPNHHGRDLDALSAHFAAYLPGITRREDLTFLLREMLGQVSISHLQIGGGDTPRLAVGPERIGLLGARFEIDRGRYRIAEIYRPGMSDRTNGLAAAAPLAQPGIGAREGDYLLAVDGKEIDAGVNLYAAFAGTAGRPVTLRFGPDPEGEGSRQAVVLPVPGENGIQRAAWFEGNRKRVEELSGGRIGYLAVPDYGPGAIEEFIGQLAAQADKDGLVIDQRFGPGGITSDTLVQMLTALPLHHYAFPYGEDLTVPTTQALGPKVLLINEHSGSASETFPLMFKLAGAGTLVGKRTAGAGTGGALYYPRFIDGGRITIPNRASYDPVAGSWAENDGVHPDVEVEIWPADWRRGRDAQLETAVEIALSQAEAAPAPVSHRPDYPVHPE